MLLHACIELKDTDLNITLFHLTYTFDVTRIKFLHLRILRAILHYVMYIISR